MQQNKGTNVMESFDKRARERLRHAADWSKTPISETATARATDPLADLWRRPQPSLSLRQISSGLLRDGEKDIEYERRTAEIAEESQRREEAGEPSRMHEIVAKQAESEGNDDELLPSETESIADWHGRIAKTIDVNGSNKSMFDALRAFCSRHPATAGARRTLDAGVIKKFIQHLRRRKAA